MDTLPSKEVADIVASMKGKVWLLIHDHHGNHVIQKSITKINELVHQAPDQDEVSTEGLMKSLNIILDEVVDSIKELVVHPYGCRVVQRLIENCRGEEKVKILDSVSKGVVLNTIISHEYGNYVVQRMLESGSHEDKTAIYDVISTKIVDLSKQKHASNVVEKMLTFGDKSQREAIIDEILDVSIFPTVCTLASN